MLLFLVDRVQDHGVINDDCTFVGEVSSFRAVLWWNQYPKDLDLYATYVDCFDQIHSLETAIQQTGQFRSLYNDRYGGGSLRQLHTQTCVFYLSRFWKDTVS